MKKFFLNLYIAIFVLVSGLCSFSYDVIEPPLTTIPAWKDYYDYTYIDSLKVENNQLDLNYKSIMIESAIYAEIIPNTNSREIIWNMDTNEVIDILDMDKITEDMIYDASSVTVNNDRIFLESCYSIIYEPVTGTPFRVTESWLEKPSECEELSLIGGAVEEKVYQYFSNELYHETFIPYIWNLKDGKLLFVGGITYQWAYPNIAYKSYFSDNCTFFCLLGLRYTKHHDSNFDYSNFAIYKDLTLIQIIPQTDGTYLFTEFDQFAKDAAFTADDRFLVTEWQGIPTLFSTYNLNVPLHRYETPSYMTACTFSPDEQKVYIACEDQKIYVFDANLPSTAAGWEVY